MPDPYRLMGQFKFESYQILSGFFLRQNTLDFMYQMHCPSLQNYSMQEFSDAGDPKVFEKFQKTFWENLGDSREVFRL